jgi:hypothetical protein
MGRAFLRDCGRALFALACLCAFATDGLASEAAAPMVACRAEVSDARRAELAGQLRAITGLPGLHFDAGGALRLGDAPPAGGSQKARALLSSALGGRRLIVIEDASGSADVVFGRVVEGRWKTGAEGRPPVYLVQIDFADFSHVMGSEAARASFDAGWALLHEVNHIVHGTVDPEGPGVLGECEGAVNLMRRELGLAERAEYFFTYLPGADRRAFKTRFVRLPFEHRIGDGGRRRHWLYWDAALTGGAGSARQVASN